MYSELEPVQTHEGEERIFGRRPFGGFGGIWKTSVDLEDHLALEDLEDHLALEDLEDHLALEDLEDHLALEDLEDRLALEDLEDRLFGALALVHF